jgi:dihydrofolate reductase
MRITLIDFMSLDGVVQAPGGAEEDTDGGFAHGGWSAPYFDVEVMGAAIDEVMQGTDALLFGRRTWQGMAAAWPDRAGDPFSDRMNSLPKYVASRTLTQADLTWSNSTLLPADDAIGAVRELRGREGGAVQVWGSASLATQLVEHDLVDEYRLMIEPVLLGGGKRVFPADGRARPLELVATATTGTGVLVCTYRPVRP